MAATTHKYMFLFFWRKSLTKGLIIAYPGKDSTKGKVLLRKPRPLKELSTRNQAALQENQVVFNPLNASVALI